MESQTRPKRRLPAVVAMVRASSIATNATERAMEIVESIAPIPPIGVNSRPRPWKCRLTILTGVRTARVRADSSAMSATVTITSEAVLSAMPQVLRLAECVHKEVRTKKAFALFALAPDSLTHEII